MAGVYKGLTVEIGANTAAFDTAINGLERKAKGLSREMKSVEKSMKLDGSGPRQLQRQMELVSQQARNASEKLELLRKAESQIGRDGMSTDQWTKLQSDIEACEAALEGYGAKMRELGAQQAADASLLGRAGQMLSEHGEAFNRVGEGMQSVGRTLTRTVTPAIIGAGAYSVKAAIDIDTALTGVKKTVDATEEEYLALKNAAIEYSKTNAVSAVDVLQAEELGGQLGVAKENLEAFAKVTTSLDIATNMNVEQASTEMARFFNVTSQVADASKSAQQQYEAYGNVIVGLGNNLATTESEISAFSLRMASAGALAGMSQAEIMGIAGALSSLGLEAEAGGTAFSRTITQIGMAVSSGTAAFGDFEAAASMSMEAWKGIYESGDHEAAAAAISRAIESNASALDAFGGMCGKTGEEFGRLFSTDAVSSVEMLYDSLSSGREELEGFAKVAGMSADEFARKWKDDAAGAFEDFIVGLAKGNEAGEDMNLVLDELGINAIRQSDALRRLAGNTDLVSEAVELAKEQWKSGAAMSNEVANRNDSLAAKFEMLKNRITAIAEEVGAPLADAMLAAVDAAEPLFEAIESGARAFSEMSEGEQRAVLQTAAFAAALGPVLTGVGGLVKGIGPLGEGLEGLAKGLAKADMKVFGTAASEASVAAGAAATGGIALLVAALAGAAIGIGNTVKEVNDYRDATSGLRDATDQAITAVSGTAGAFDEQAGAAESSRDRIKSAMEEQARIARDLAADMSEVGKDTALLDAYTQKIAELAGHCDGDAQKLGDLRVAVEQYNAITGENVSVIDGQTGAIDRSTASLQANAEAWRAAAYSAALQEKMTELAKVQIDNQENLAAASEKLKVAEAELAEVRENTPWDTDKILEATLKVEGLKDQVAEAKDATEANEQAMARLSDQAGEMAQREAEAREESARLASEHERLRGELEGAGVEAERASGLLAELDAQGLDPKSFYVDDNGSIRDNKGRLVDLDAQTVNGKSYTVTDDGTCATELDKQAELNAYPIPDKEAVIKGDDSGARQAIESTKSGLDSIPPNTETTVTAIDNASGVLSGIVGWLNSITDRTATVTTRHVTIAEARNASGGVSIPQHMAGAIVTQATLTDMGIVGEAGAEAILQGANGARAIVPLTNRQYVRPFAQAVAAEMGGAQRPVVNNSTYYNVNGITYEPDSRMASLVEQVVDMAIVEDRM